MKSSLSKRYGLKMFTDFILMVLVVFLVLIFIGTVKVYHTETFSPNMNNNNWKYLKDLYALQFKYKNIFIIHPNSPISTNSLIP